MTFSELATYVAGSFSPKRYTSVSVELCTQSTGSQELTVHVFVGSTEYDKGRGIFGNSIDEARAKFDVEWGITTVAVDPATEMEKVDVP